MHGYVGRHPLVREKEKYKRVNVAEDTVFRIELVDDPSEKRGRGRNFFKQFRYRRRGKRREVDRQ